MSSNGRSRSVWILAVLAACTPGAAPTTPALTVRTATVDQLVRMRCAHDGRDVVMTWTGDVYAFVPDERPRHLFAVVGMNIARCVRDGGHWHLTSRELMLYLDPEVKRRVDEWKNPWTSEVVPVVHVANRLVQNRLDGRVTMAVAAGLATITFDIPLFYPNPLAADDAAREFSPAANYQAGEFFTFTTPVAAIEDSTSPSVPVLAFTWHRIGPWLPWMAMGQRAGHLIYIARGRKLSGIAELPAPLRDELVRLPLFGSAPRCLVAAKNETSWTYFLRHLAEYRARRRFPLPAPLDLGECATTPSPARADAG